MSDSNAPGGRLQVLCIEDEPGIRDVITDFLQEEGFDTHEAGNGKEALDVIASTPLDLILCDVNMPEMDGYEFLFEIRENHRELDKVPFIFVSAYRQDTDVEKGMALGADDYLGKPVDFDLLLKTIQEVLFEHHAVKQASG